MKKNHWNVFLLPVSANLQTQSGSPAPCSLSLSLSLITLITKGPIFSPNAFITHNGPGFSWQVVSLTLLIVLLVKQIVGWIQRTMSWVQLVEQGISHFSIAIYQFLTKCLWGWGTGAGVVWSGKGNQPCSFWFELVFEEQFKSIYGTNFSVLKADWCRKVMLGWIQWSTWAMFMDFVCFPMPLAVPSDPWKMCSWIHSTHMAFWVSDLQPRGERDEIASSSLTATLSNPLLVAFDLPTFSLLRLKRCGHIDTGFCNCTIGLLQHALHGTALVYIKRQAARKILHNV